MAAPQIVTISSLADVDDVLENRGINAVGQIDQVQFRLAERTSLKAATKLKLRVRPGRLGFRLLNPELMYCKFATKVELDEAYESMFTDCLDECTQQLVPLEARIAELKRLLLLPDNQLQGIGPDILQRNRGVHHVLYPHPPLPLYFESEGHPNQRVPYQGAFATDAERDHARALDLRAQRAWWRTNLNLLEIKKKICEEKRKELERELRSEWKKSVEDESDLGIGYANFNFLHR